MKQLLAKNTKPIEMQASIKKHRPLSLKMMAKYKGRNASNLKKFILANEKYIIFTTF